jgi:hypothetical protein
MAHVFFKEKRPHNGLTYNEYTALIVRELEGTNPEKPETSDKEHYDKRKINYQRSKRLNNHFQPSVKLIDAINLIKQPQLWMVITESWCGDSAQNLPIIAKAAELNDKIDLRIIFRDDNPDIMDSYLSDGGKRSIPVLVAFDIYGNEIFKWGPRPTSAAELVAKLIKEGYSKEKFLHDLHLWYGKNRGKETDSELAALIRESVQ